MPFVIRKKRNQSCYQVTRKATKNKPRRIMAKCTTLAKAKKQVYLLRSITAKKKKALITKKMI